MRHVVMFDDGSRLRFGRVQGERFNPSDGDTYLFEMPGGEIKEGVVTVFEGSEADARKAPVANGVYDAQSRVIAVDV